MVLLLVLVFAVSGPAIGAKKKLKPPIKTAAPIVKIISLSDIKPPEFIYRPSIFPQYVTNSDNLPVLTFSPDEDVNIVVDQRDGTGKNRLQGELLADTAIKKGVKTDVAWKIAALPNGDYNFHIIMTDLAGNRTEFNAPFTVYIRYNPNTSLILE
jgi:hypothetical protein